MISFFKKSSDNFFVVEHIDEFSKGEINKLTWLFNGSEFLNIKKLKGNYIGPIKEMTTPWSTNAVEISKNIGINSTMN